MDLPPFFMAAEFSVGGTLPPDRSQISTEGTNPASVGLDEMPIADAVRLMNAADAEAVRAVESQAGPIAAAVGMVAAALRSGGRLIYIGAGTSGRLGVLDASECPPTFCSDPNQVVGIIAGGAAALTRSIEGVEDDRAAGAEAIAGLHVDGRDVVVGIAAGGTTPFVHAALAEAAERGAKTIFVACVERSQIAATADLFICLPTGPEILTGSTRLKAGTATKLVLNTLSTLALVQLGKVYGHYMVDVDALKNAKLVDRGIRIISAVGKVDRGKAAELLEAAGGKVKTAIVMALRGCEVAEAKQLLDGGGGSLRRALN
jgi:N-acetylmuramic acid 6-phosphate etherase